MAREGDLSKGIVSFLKKIEVVLKSKKDYKNDAEFIDLLFFGYKIYYTQIHDYLVGLNTDFGEKEIRRHIRDIRQIILVLLERKIKESAKKIEILDKYLELYDNFMALVAFRSLKHFAIYMEYDKRPEEKLWEPTMHLFEGFWYYANSMVLNGDVKFISKQCFTGLGKTYSNAILLSFIFGNDLNADALYVFGASENVATFTLGVIDLMTSSRYLKIFPYFQQFEGENKDATINKMFSTKQAKDSGSRLRIEGSRVPVNLRVVSKDKNTNGVRAKYLFIDDIAQFSEANNPKALQKDIDKMNNEWFKRNYNLRDFHIIASGTTYSTLDILTYLIERNNIENAEESKINKFTKVVKSNYILIGGTSAFVSIPKLDYVTDESTYPEKYPTAEARMQRDLSTDDGRMFEAMEQQRPIPFDTNPFDYKNLKLYETLPLKEHEGGTREDGCRMVIDPSRKGIDATCALVFSKDRDEEYLVNAFLDKRPLDFIYPDGFDVIDKLCDLIIGNKVYSLIVEENTNATVVSQISDRLASRGWYSTKIKGIYSTKTKKDKIYNASPTIVNVMRFPSRRVFAPNSMVGRAMRDLVNWQYKDKIADDSADCCAMFVEEFLGVDTIGLATVQTFSRRRPKTFF